MTVRTAVAVVLAGALLAVALPAAEDAVAANARAEADRQAGAVVDAVDALAGSDPAVPGGPGASRTVTVSVPEGPLVGSGGYLALGGVPDGRVDRDGPDGDVIVYRPPSGAPTVVARLDVDLRVAWAGGVAPDHVPLVVRDDADLELTVLACGDDPTVVVAES